MKFIRFIANNEEKIGVLDKTELKIIKLFDVEKTEIDPMITIIRNLTKQNLKDIREKIKNKAGEYRLEDVKICSPIKKTIHDVICVGVNYKEHLLETQNRFDNNFKTPSKIVFFSKRSKEIIGTNDYIISKLQLDNNLDYEVELAVIIGKEGVNILKEDVNEYIFGYSIFNDISSRKLQKDHIQWFRGKSLDTYSIMGPVILHSSSIESPIELNISCEVNGEIRQNSNTRFFISDIPTIISEISQGITLEPGDIIITGTPEGVGMGFEPPKYLQKDDIIKCKIEKIGELINKVK
ncbi:fumarylacetoacetate hydrolase family protein [Fusobacterium sp.]|uniref:fumarylacetoacetate hydrolase family protein n=1 Tax=Fusobacterium sp. TaxID=68766 RepID=UPI0025B9CF90|nr:fumarylacetoacetate hydrolase family protein [Fusobacterium sp.]